MYNGNGDINSRVLLKFHCFRINIIMANGLDRISIHVGGMCMADESP